jgi:hypothetical protein
MNFAEKIFPICPTISLQSLDIATSVEHFSGRKLVVGRPDEQSMIITSGKQILPLLTPSAR